MAQARLGATSFVVLCLVSCTRPVSEEDLAQRIAESRPTWQNYHEDMKAQLGATPAAQWQGEPVAASVEGDLVRIVFEIAGPWRERTQAAPILIEEPQGGVYQNTGVRCDGATVVYAFELPSPPVTPPAWLDVKYPSGRRRLALAPDGTWRKPPA